MNTYRLIGQLEGIAAMLARDNRPAALLLGEATKKLTELTKGGSLLPDQPKCRYSVKRDLFTSGDRRRKEAKVEENPEKPSPKPITDYRQLPRKVACANEKCPKHKIKTWKKNMIKFSPGDRKPPVWLCNDLCLQAYKLKNGGGSLSKIYDQTAPDKTWIRRKAKK